MRKSGLIPVVAAIAVIVSAGPAFAEQVPWNGIMVGAATAAAQPEVRGGTEPEGPAPDTYGTSQWIGYAVGPCDGYVRSSGVGISNGNCVSVEAAADGFGYVGFPIHLPQGASMQYLRIYYYGNNVGVSISAGLFKVSATGAMTLVQGASPAATAGGAAMQQFGPFAETVDNFANTYDFLAVMEKSGASVTRIYKVYIYYKLQVSPAPGTATFSDVPTGHWAFKFVEALAASGITSGCAAGQFCPDNPITRAEMAVFLSAALGLSYEY